MTNEVSYAPIKYVCNGLSVDFAFPWKIFQAEDLIVTIQGQEGILVLTLELEKDFTVEFDDVGGNVKTNKAWPDGTILVVARNTDDYQSKDFTTSTGFQASEIEKAFDRVSCNLQEMDYNIENFKETFSKQVGEEIDVLENVIEENKQEVLLIQERFEDEVNVKIEQVSEAAGKINELEQAVQDAQTSADNAQASANEALTQKEDLISQGEQLIQDVSKEVARVEDAINDIDKNINKIVNHVSFNLFDTKTSDHILEGNEAKGWALQGTYVNKESYPDFYNKCLEEYKNSNLTLDVVENWIQPVLTENGILGGDTFAVSAVNEVYPAFRCFASDRNTAEPACWQSNASQSSFTLYNPIALNITNIKITNKTSYVRAIASGKVLGSNDNEIWEEIKSFSNTNNSAGASWNIDLSDNTKFFKYYKLDSLTGLESGFVCIGCMDITATAPLFNYLKNLNGHKFYPISNKTKVDTFYDKHGIADFYGIDEENERVFLPRNKCFHQLTNDLSKLNEMVEAGLPNIEGKFSPINAVNTGVTASGAFEVDAVWGVADSNNGGSTAGRIALDASLSSIIYGNSDTVQPPSSLKLLYYCVGNTEVTQAITNVTEITTSKNDTIPLFTGMYFNFKPNSVSWLKAGEQQNNGGIYKTCYDTLVEIVNGVKDYDLKVINIQDKQANIDYSEYWILDQDNLSFRTPIVASYPTNRVLVAKKEPSSNDPSWFNLYSDGWLEQGGKYHKNVTTEIYITLPKAYKDTTYTCCFSLGEGFKVTSQQNNLGYAYSTTELYYNETNTGYVYWVTSGYAKTPSPSEYTEKVSFYFKVANAVQNLELLDVGEVMEAVNDINSNALTRVNKEEIVSWGIPDYSAGIDITWISGSNTVASITYNYYYEAPVDGFVVLSIFGSNGREPIAVNSSFVYWTVNSGGNIDGSVYLPVAKGDKVWCVSGNNRCQSKMFFPLKGAK